MKLINIEQKYKSSLRLWVLWGSGLGLGACGYDPNDVAESNSGEPQPRTLSDDIWNDLVVTERIVLKASPGKIHRRTILDGAAPASSIRHGAVQTEDCRDIEEITQRGAQ